MADPATGPTGPTTRAGAPLTLALVLAGGLAAAFAVCVVLPPLLVGGTASSVYRTSLLLLLAGDLVIGIVLLGVLYRPRPRRDAGGPLPAAPVETTPAAARDLDALLASSGRTDEIGALMREFTRILEVLQEQASQVQNYAGRFETINEELRNANLRLRELSLTDELTEVGNRRNFDVRMREEINRSTRFGHAFSLLLLDIDAFKKFNDEFGHPQGDAVLRGLGTLMRSMSREGDVPCRIGGEEFAVILPETGKADGLAFAERMRRSVESTLQSPDDARPITISIGLAAFPEDGKLSEDLVRAADDALYDSKRTGRNRVTAYLRK